MRCLTEVSLDEYRRVREQLFDTNMKLIETEALFKNRQAELECTRSRSGPGAVAPEADQGRAPQRPGDRFADEGNRASSSAKSTWPTIERGPEAIRRWSIRGGSWRP